MLDASPCGCPVNAENPAIGALEGLQFGITISHCPTTNTITTTLKNATGSSTLRSLSLPPSLTLKLRVSIINMGSIELPQVTYKGQPVLTARAVAEVLGCDPQQIKDNFKYNRKKHTEGVDYFKLTFAEAKTMGLPTTGTPTLEGGNSYLRFFRCSPMGSVLFTRRGLAKLSKSVGTPQAWAMMETFIDAYFTLEGMATGALSPQEGAAKAAEVVKAGMAALPGIQMQGAGKWQPVGSPRGSLLGH